MSEPTVQVPVSLIERAARAADLVYPGVNHDTDVVRDLRALLSQSTPTAEPPMCGAISALTNDPCVEDAGHNGRHMSIRGFSWQPLAQWKATIRDVQPPAEPTPDLRALA